MSKKVQTIKRDYDVEASTVTLFLKDSPDLQAVYSPSLPETMLPLHVGAVLQHGADVIATFINNAIGSLGKTAAEAFESVKEIITKLEDGTLPTRKGAAGEAAVTAEDKYKCLRDNLPKHANLSAEATAKFLAFLDAEYAKTTEVTKKKKDGTTYVQLKRSGLNKLINSSQLAQDVLAKYLDQAQEADPLATMFS